MIGSIFLVCRDMGKLRTSWFDWQKSMLLGNADQKSRISEANVPTFFVCLVNWQTKCVIVAFRWHLTIDETIVVTLKTDCIFLSCKCWENKSENILFVFQWNLYQMPCLFVYNWFCFQVVRTFGLPVRTGLHIPEEPESMWYHHQQQIRLCSCARIFCAIETLARRSTLPLTHIYTYKRRLLDLADENSHKGLTNWK